MSKRAITAAAVLTTALAGCSSDGSVQKQVTLYKTLVSGALHHGSGAPVHLTRAQIRKFGQPLLLVTTKKDSVRAYLVIAGQSGPVTTWLTQDGVSVSLRNGLVTQTRGLGQDLMSASLPPISDIRRGAGTVRATYFYLDGNDQSFALPLTCKLSTHGTEARTIAGLRYRLRHVSETCDGPETRFANDYWLDRQGRIRASRQWLGPTLGYYTLSDLREKLPPPAQG